jgi:hypothetical protein
VSNPQSQMYRLLSTSVALPCGYVMGVHGALASGIPGLKSETWGTLRVFPLALVGRENSHTGLGPYPSSTDALLFLELLASELRIACVHQRGVNDRAQNCFRLIPLASNSLQLLGCLTAPPFHPQRLDPAGEVVQLFHRFSCERRVLDRPSLAAAVRSAAYRAIEAVQGRGRSHLRTPS